MRTTEWKSCPVKNERYQILKYLKWSKTESRISVSCSQCIFILLQSVLWNFYLRNSPVYAQRFLVAFQITSHFWATVVSLPKTKRCKTEIYLNFVLQSLKVQRGDQTHLQLEWKCSEQIHLHRPHYKHLDHTSFWLYLSSNDMFHYPYEVPRQMILLRLGVS